MPAYYNEFKPEAAHMLRQLIRDGLIAAWDVDKRSIVDVRADGLRQYEIDDLIRSFDETDDVLASA